MKQYVDPSVPLKPKFVREQIREMRAHLECIEKHLAEAKRRHKRIDSTNRQFGKLEYHLWQTMMHASFVRCKMDLTFDKTGADGNGKQYHTFPDGTMYKCYSEGA